LGGGMAVVYRATIHGSADIARTKMAIANLRDHASDLRKQKSALQSNPDNQIEKLDF
jgi:hypothetical protein